MSSCVDALPHLKDLVEFLAVVGLGELDFAHVKATDPADLPALVDYSGRLALRLGEDHIDEILGARHLGGKAGRVFDMMVGKVGAE